MNGVIRCFGFINYISDRYNQLSKWYFYTNRFQYDGFVVIKTFSIFLENWGGIRGFTEFQWVIILTIVAVSIMIWYFIQWAGIVFRFQWLS